ncbi:MAG: DUF420 domain-containing protein [Acidobacteria bacterium]|nr:DUF420 domain-containing protein [Acidobacteriota bacterium]
MIPIELLPTLNAALNSLSAILLVNGYLCIRKKKIAAHKASMISAVVTSSLFLISYLFYHYHIGSRRFEGEGWIRPVYFSILISHTILAATIVPLVIVTLKRAWKGNFSLHARIARRTLPLWLYVSVTGVIVYWMLYRL